MSYYELNKEHAKKLLNIAIKNNNILDFVLCRGLYQILPPETIKQNGFPVQIIMQSIYETYEEQPETKLDSKFFEEVKNYMLGGKTGGIYVIRLLYDIEYQLEAEKDKKAPFHINCNELLKLISDCIKKNKEKFESYDPVHLARGLMPEFEEHDDYLDRHFGHKIL